MKRTHRKRLWKVSRQIDELPLAHATQDAAFERFRETGELPEYQRLALAVVDRALHGGEASRYMGSIDWAACNRELKRMVEGIGDAEPPKPSVRELLFN